MTCERSLNLCYKSTDKAGHCLTFWIISTVDYINLCTGNHSQRQRQREPLYVEWIHTRSYDAAVHVMLPVRSGPNPAPHPSRGSDLSWLREKKKKKVSPPGEVDASNHDSLTITVWPASWKSPFPWADASSSSQEDFWRFWEAKSNIHTGRGWERRRHLQRLPACMRVQKHSRMLMVVDCSCVFGVQYWKNTFTNPIRVDYFQSKCCFLKWSDWAPSQRSRQPWGQDWLLLPLSWSGFTLGGDPFPTEWVGMHYFDSSSPPFPQTTKPPYSTGVYSPANHGRPHSQPPRVNNVPNNYVTVFGLPCEKVSPPSPRCVTVCKWEEAKVWELDLMEQGQTTVLRRNEWHL